MMNQPIHGHRKGTILSKSPRVVDEDLVSQRVWVAVKFNHLRKDLSRVKDEGQEQFNVKREEKVTYWLILHVGRAEGEEDYSRKGSEWGDLPMHFFRFYS